MDRTCFAILCFGLSLLPTISASAADKAVDKNLPYSFIAVQIVPDDVRDAVEYCKSQGVAVTGLLGEIVGEIATAEEFSEFDLTQPVRFEVCASSAGDVIQLVALTGTKQAVITIMDEDLSAVPGYNGLFQILDDEDKNSDGTYVRFENDRCYLTVGDGPLALTPELADKLLTRLKRDDKHNSRFQWSISSRPCEINPPVRKLWLKALTKATSVQLQQRDDEDDLSYQLRSFWGKTRLAMINTFAADCEYIEAGFRVDPDEHRGTMELTIKARENSTLDRWMTKTGKARSPFTGMMQDEGRTGFALSFELGETQKDSLKSLAAATSDALVANGQPASEADAFSKMINEQIKRGAVHAYVQMGGLDRSFSSMSGGISLKNGEAVTPVLKHVLTDLAKQESSVLIGHPESDQPVIHFMNDPFGMSNKSTMALTANSNGIWFALGEETGTREKYKVSVQDPEQEAVRTVEKSRLVNVQSPDARERLVNLIAEVQQSRQSRERGFMVQSFVSDQVWSAVTLLSQFGSNETETKTETYEVQVPNADGTMRTEQRTRTVVTQTNGGFKNSTAVEVADGENVDSKIQQVAATEEKKTKSEKLNGQIRLTTEPVKDGLRIRGEFEKSAIMGLMLFPDFLGAAAEVLGLE